MTTIVPDHWRAMAPDLELALRGVASKEKWARRPLRHPWAWRRGFGSASVDLLGLQRGRCDGYLSDVAERLLWRRVPDWNFDPLLNDKMLFHEIFEASLGDALPRLLGMVVDGRLRERLGTGDYSGPRTSVLELLDDQTPSLVLKPRDGAHGRGIFVVHAGSEGLVVNGRSTSHDELRRWEEKVDGYLVTQFISQADYSRAVFPAAVNTIRLTMANDTEQPLFIRPVHRFGTSASAPADNFGKGGISARVDLATGELGPAAQAGPDGRLRWHDDHPETGTPIRGTLVPGWPEVLALGRRLAETMPFIRLVGWDIAITEKGPRLIEGNHMTALLALQKFGPLLPDEGVEELCRRHGVPTGTPWRTLLGR